MVREILSELVRNGFRRIIVLSGHAGNSHMVACGWRHRILLWQTTNAQEKVRIMVLSDYDFAKRINPKYAPETMGTRAHWKLPE